MAKRKTIRVLYVKLGREKIWGQSGGDGTIEIDPRIKGKKFCEILIHECLHELFPDAEEEEIEYKAAVLARTMWAQGFRPVDNHAKERMQDDYKPNEKRTK